MLPPTFAIALALTLVLSPNPSGDEQQLTALLTVAAQTGVREKLRDPDSANFRKIAIHRGPDPKDDQYYVCGEVNSKNGYGGYSGFAAFYVLTFYSKETRTAFTGVTAIDDDGKIATYIQNKCVN